MRDQAGLIRDQRGLDAGSGRFEEESIEFDAGHSGNMPKGEFKKVFAAGFFMNCSTHFIGNGKDRRFKTRSDVLVFGNVSLC